MEVNEAIGTKRAIRHFTEQAIPDKIIRRILNAGRRAQSSKNSQPWNFVAIRDKDTLKKLSECGTYAGHMAGAAFAVALVTTDPSARWAIAFDTGQAAAYMQLAAWEMGIGSCLASIYEPEKAKASLGIPEDLFFDVAISFGFLAPHQGPPEVKQAGRRPFDEVVHWERW